jgi:hypothetical protein
MSTLDEKLDQGRPSVGRARAMLRRHLADAQVLESDARGPTRVQTVTHGRVAQWVRVATRDGDAVMELEWTSSP